MILGVLNLVYVCLLIPWLALRFLVIRMTQQIKKQEAKPCFAFFHPYCNDGGGGERVLWNLIRVAQKLYGEKMRYRLYHGESLSGDEILAKTQSRFGISLPHTIEFVSLSRRAWVESSRYPVLTMLGQALGAVVLGFDALLAKSNDVPPFMFDSMGFAFAYPVFVLFGSCKVLSYTHYPVISTDMLEKVIARRPSHNNSAVISNSAALSFAKSSYYRLFARLYGWTGRWSSLTMVNSKWTRDHINSIWKCPETVHVVFPATDTASVSKLKLEGREDLVISIAQFRPEKDHALQMRAFALFLARNKKSNVQLVMIGSVRNDADQAIVDGIRALGDELGLKEGKHYVLATNVSYSTLLEFYGKAKVGLHSMWNEHFGIGIVELMAAGVLTVAHDSGGPKSDILKADAEGRQIGFAATSAEDYAAAIEKALAIRGTEMQQRARVAMNLFSEESFEKHVSKLLIQQNLK